MKEIKTLFEEFLTDMEKGDNGNKSAAARARKTSLEIAKAMKAYRARSLGKTE